MKQFICFFSGLLLLFVSTTRVVAQEVSDYSQLSDEDYSKIVLPPTIRFIRERQEQSRL